MLGAFCCLVVALLLTRSDGIEFWGVICSFDTELFSNLFVNVYSPHIF